MPWTARIGTTVVDLDDLSIDDYDRAARTAPEQGVTWAQVWVNPLSHGAAPIRAVLHAAAALAGVDPPADPLKPRQVLDMFEYVQPADGEAGDEGKAPSPEPSEPG